MSYNIIQPPLAPFYGLHEQTLPDLRAYYKWFLEQIPLRIKELESVVQESTGYESWQANLSERSLESLGVWLATQVNKRQLTPKEIEDYKKTINFPAELPVPEWDLDVRTLSLCMDIAMYFGEVMCHNYPNIHWDIPLKRSRRFIDFGSPVLVGFGHGYEKVPMNPVFGTKGVARKLVKDAHRNWLIEGYRVWMEFAKL